MKDRKNGIILIDGYLREIEKHIGSIQKLKTSRIEAKNVSGSHTVFMIERIILQRICSTNYENSNALLFNSNTLMEILTEWKIANKLEERNNVLFKNIKECIENDTVFLLKIIVKYSGHHPRSKLSFEKAQEMHRLINVAAKYNAFQCIQFLLEAPQKLQWINQIKPRCLLNAVKYNPDCLKLIHFIIDRLETVKMMFICDDIMKLIIYNDLADIAKRIINNQWCSITESDILHAKFIRGKCFELLSQENLLTCVVEDKLIQIPDTHS